MLKSLITIFVATCACIIANINSDPHKIASQLNKVEGVWIEQKVTNINHFSAGFYKVIMDGEHQVLWIKDGILKHVHGGVVSYNGKTLVENPLYTSKANNLIGKTLKFNVIRLSQSFSQERIIGSGNLEQLKEKWNKVGKSNHQMEGTWNRPMDDGKVMTKMIVDNFWHWVVVDLETSLVVRSIGGTYSYDGRKYVETTHFKMEDTEDSWELGHKWEAIVELKNGNLLFHVQNSGGKEYTESWIRFDPDAPLYNAAKGETGMSILAMEHAWSAAQLKSDPAPIAAILAENWSSITPGGKRVSRTQALEGVTKSKLTRSESSDMKVRMVNPNTAIVTGVWTGVGIGPEGEKIDTSELWTDVYVEMSGQWKCVASQSSAIRK